MSLYLPFPWDDGFLFVGKRTVCVTHTEASVLCVKVDTQTEPIALCMANQCDT